MSFTSSGVDLWRIETIIALRATLFPEPVEPAISRWGISARFPTLVLPVMSLPRQSVNREGDAAKSLDSMISRR